MTDDGLTVRRRDRIIGAVVSAIAAGATVAGAYIAATRDDVSVDVVRDEVVDAVLDSAMVLRSMGRSEGEIVDIIVSHTGAPRDRIAGVVHDAHSSEREPRTIRTHAATIVVQHDEADAAWMQIAEAHCDPLLLAGEMTDDYVACIEGNAIQQGEPMCVDGRIAGYLVRQHVTDAHMMRLRSRGLVDDVPDGWGPCPDEAP